MVLSMEVEPHVLAMDWEVFKLVPRYSVASWNQTSSSGQSTRLAAKPGIQKEGLAGIPKRRIVPALASLSAQFDHHMLDLSILFKGVHRHIFADAALFVAAMRHL